jgi:hypothetical protein
MSMGFGSAGASWLAASGLAPAAMGTPIASIPPLGVNSVSPIPAQALLLFLCTAAQNAVLTRLGTYLQTAGVTAGPGVNQFGIYTAAGALLGQTADMTAAMGVAGLCEGILTVPVPVNAGINYYLAMLANFTGTAPGSLGYSGQAITHGPTFQGLDPNLFQAATAALPVSFNPLALANGGTVNYIYGRP